MTISTAEIIKKINLNAPVEQKLQNALDSALNRVNVSLRAGAAPKSEDVEDVVKALDDLKPTVQWLAALNCVKSYAEQKKITVLSDDDIKTALVKALKYTSHNHKVNPNTGLWEKSSKQTKFDILGLLNKLGVDCSVFKSKMSAILCGVALLADRRVNKSKGKAEIIARYKGDADIKAALSEGKDVGTLSYLQTAVGNAMKAFLPSSDYTPMAEDAEYFYIVSTKLDKKKLCGTSAGLVKEAYEGFFDRASSLLNTGAVKYQVGYKYKEVEEKEYVTAEDQEEAKEVKTEEPKPEEAPKTEEPKSEVPAAEPVAAKPAKEPKSKKEPTSKRGSKDSKKSDKTAA